MSVWAPESSPCRTAFSTSGCRHRNGTPVAGSTLRDCMRPAGGPQAKDACMNQLGLHFSYSYQPAVRADQRERAARCDPTARRELVEMQFDAFAYPAFEQIVSHVAKMRNWFLALWA